MILFDTVRVFVYLLAWDVGMFAYLGGFVLHIIKYLNQCRTLNLLQPALKLLIC